MFPQWGTQVTERRNNSPRPPAYQQAKLPLYSPAIPFSQLKCSAEPITVMARGAEEQENASGQCSTFDVPASSLLLSCCPRGRAGTGARRSRYSSEAVFPEAGSLSRRDPQCTELESHTVFPGARTYCVPPLTVSPSWTCLASLSLPFGSSVAYPSGYNMRV